MSLVGNIEDMGLADILQIISLSRRSGVMSLESRGRKARIIFQHGQVTRANSTALKQHIGEVLIQKGIIDPAILEGALRIQVEEGYKQLLGTIMVERFNVSLEAIEKILTEQIENVVYSLFTWTKGTFTFEIQEVAEADAVRMDPVQFMLKQGLNPQFLAMEGSRIIDEKRHRGELDEEPEEVAMPGPVPDAVPPSEVISRRPFTKASAPQEPAVPPFSEENAAPFESGPSPYAKVTAGVIMTLGCAVLVYGIAGLTHYYSRGWQAALPDPDLVTISTLSIFFRFGMVPWVLTLFSLYLVWAAYEILKRQKDSASRLMRCAWTGVAMAVIHEAVEFGNWVKLASSTPRLSFYGIGIISSVFEAAVLSAPFAGLLIYLKRNQISLTSGSRR